MQPRPLIIDTDPGIDDAMALLLAAASPEVDLRAVTTVHGNVTLDHTTRNALRLLALAGRDDVPVGAGADRAFLTPASARAAHVHGEDGLGGVVLPEAKRSPDPRGAVGLMADILRQSPEPVTIAAIGPLTNVALLLASYPQLIDRIERLVILGGSGGWPSGGGLGRSNGSGNATPAAEFNFWCDPEAAYRALAETVPTTLVGLGVTYRVVAPPEWVDQLRGGGPVAEAAADMLGFYLGHYQHALQRRAVAMHDAVALAEVIRPGLLVTEPRHVTVDFGHGAARGATVVDERADRVDTLTTVDLAVEADAPAILDLIAERLRSYGG